MSFFIQHRHGATDRDPPLSALPKLMAELDGPDDPEHNSVALTHESEWCLSVSKGGYVTFENVEDGEPRRLANVPNEKILRLWQKLAAGEIAELEKEPWLRGY